MNTEWDGQGASFPEDRTGADHNETPVRLDSLLPCDPETGVVSFDALQVYLAAFMDLMGRHQQPLTLLYIAADLSVALRSLGVEGMRLIDRAMARWLRQETRIHDVVGLSDKRDAFGPTCFLMVCPLMTEQHAGEFAERLRSAMTADALDEGAPWLTISVGVASLSLDSSSPDALLMRAEEAHRSAQRGGGGRVWKHSDTLRRIIENNQSDSLDE